MGLNGASQSTNLAEGFARPRHRPPLSRRQKATMAGATIVIVALVLTPSLNDWYLGGEHTKDISREAGTRAEREALRRSESMDLASALGVERHWPTGLLGLLWSNFTDRETIDYYADRIDQLDRERYRYDAALDYTAECHHVDRLFLLPSSTWETRSVTHAMASSNPEAELEGDLAKWDLDDLPREGEWYLLEDAFVVRQRLVYEERTGSYDFINEIEQVIILDAGHRPRVVLVDREFDEIPLCY